MKWRWAQSVNHWVGASLMSAASSPNDENDRTGAINRIFKYVHAARDAGQRLKKKNPHSLLRAEISRYCCYFCRDNPFQPPLKPGRGMELPAAACSILGVSLKAFPGLESIHPDNFHFRQSRLPDSGSALSGLRSAFLPIINVMRHFLSTRQN